MKIKTALMLIIIFPSTIMANIKHAPPAFNVEGGKAIFVDFKKADYSLNYDSSKKILTAETSITFESFEEGMPVFDMVESPTNFQLDGVNVITKVINSIDKDTWFRIALKTIKPGVHTFLISSTVTRGVLFLTNGVSSAFWLNDLSDRSLLEAYLPANFEYDQYKITLYIDFKNMDNQKIFSNGEITKKPDNKFVVEFPETYNSSALYYHTAPIGRFPEKTFSITSINGNTIPVVVYSKDTSTNLESVKKKVTTMVQNLEASFGPWLHKKVVIHIAGMGGMEYCGATMTDLGSLNHELTHSYFARGGLMPSNGNSGWIDEALTTWINAGMYIKTNLNGVMANMANNSPYRRYTDDRAYSTGASFMAYLHFYYQASGGLTPFLNHLIQTNAFIPMTTQEFENKLTLYYGDDVTNLFRNHVYQDKKASPEQTREHPVHKKMTISEMEKLL